MLVGRVSLLAAAVGGGAAAPRSPNADFTLTNGVVSATISPSGLSAFTRITERALPATGKNSGRMCAAIAAL